MRHLFLTLGLLLSLLSLAQEKPQYKEYSYTQFFKMIEDEKDSTFILENAIIKYDTKTDSAFRAPMALDQDSVLNRPKRLIIDKKIELTNVQFFAGINQLDQNGGMLYGALVDIDFKKDVVLNETAALNIYNCQFRQSFTYNFLSLTLDSELAIEGAILSISHSTFNRFYMYKSTFNQNNFKINPNFRFNKFISEDDKRTTLSIGFYGFYNSLFKDNLIESKGSVWIHHGNGSNGVQFSGNKIKCDDVSLSIQSMQGKFEWKDNDFSTTFQVYIDKLNKQDEIDWSQLRGKMITSDGFLNFRLATVGNKMYRSLEPSRRRSLLKAYVDSVRYYDNSAFANEIALHGQFYEHYKSKYITATANEVYLELKDFETERLKVLYEQNKTFDSYFKWKINQFLKLFAAYGTEPARAITMSVYVVLAFALIYLFFPNYWDSHGKNRIKDRFLFFHKYLRHNKGIQDVYLEEQQAELQSAYAFQRVLDEHKTEVPGFFYSAAKPLYRWSVAGTTLYAKLLSRIDFLKGSWKETEPKKRKLRTALTIVVFIFALLYDLFIKVLNALMLSINTFTTLGFGEIPIKGLPRYLAIIQGFIGWFMLTIFSVSLISQLLN